MTKMLNGGETEGVKRSIEIINVDVGRSSDNIKGRKTKEQAVSIILHVGRLGVKFDMALGNGKNSEKG